MKFLFFIGIDVSKKKLDVAVRDRQQLLFHVTVDNSAIGLNDFKTVCIDKGIDLHKSLFCCEHTGRRSLDFTVNAYWI